MQPKSGVPNRAKRGVAPDFDGLQRPNPAALRSNFGDLINAAALQMGPRSATAGGQDRAQMTFQASQ
jgi:hypothetical protein